MWMITLVSSPKLQVPKHMQHSVSHFCNMFLVREVEVFSKDFSFISLPVYVNDCDAKKKFKEKKTKGKNASWMVVYEVIIISLLAVKIKTLVIINAMPPTLLIRLLNPNRLLFSHYLVTLKGCLINKESSKKECR